MVLILSCVLFLWACLGDSTSSVKSVHPVHQALGTVHTVDQGQFEFEPNRPLCRPLLCAASTGPTLSYAGSISTLMARPDFLQYPAYQRPILPTPLCQFSVTSNFQNGVEFIKPVSEFNEFKPRLYSFKNRFPLSAGLNLEKFNTILSGTNQPYLNRSLNLSRSSNSLKSTSGC